MASSLGLPSGARPCAASESRGLILAAQPVVRPIASIKREITAVNVRMRFINQVITQSWMKQQQFRMDRAQVGQHPVILSSSANSERHRSADRKSTRLNSSHGYL